MTQEQAGKGTARQVFGSMLRFYRERAGLSREQLGELAHVSGALIGAYETAKRVPVQDTTAQIDAVSDLGTGGALNELWRQFEDGMTYKTFPDWFQDWWETEARAVRMRSFEPNIVPGLLQTVDYMRAIFRSSVGVTEEEIDELVAARLKRQEILTRERPPELWVILDEWVLRRPVGGAYVMLEQVNRLIEAAQQPHIVLQSIPASVGAHRGLVGSFVIAFDGAATVGYQEAPIRDECVRSAEGIAALERIWSTLGTVVLPRAASLVLLEEAAKSWTSLA